MPTSFLTTTLRDKDFNRQLLHLVIPIALQNLISALAVTVDVVMLGFINQSAMSAVSLAGQITFVLTLFYMGLAAGAGILTAQLSTVIARVVEFSCCILHCAKGNVKFKFPARDGKIRD